MKQLKTRIVLSGFIMVSIITWLLQKRPIFKWLETWKTVIGTVVCCRNLFDTQVVQLVNLISLVHKGNIVGLLYARLLWVMSWVKVSSQQYLCHSKTGQLGNQTCFNHSKTGTIPVFGFYCIQIVEASLVHECSGIFMASKILTILSSFYSNDIWKQWGLK